MTKTWAISSAKVGQPFSLTNLIETSRGRPYAELRTIARRMSHNFEGMRYTVMEVGCKPRAWNSPGA